VRVLAVYSLKGGVGKTSAAVNLAYLASASGQRALLWDLDPQGAASYLLRVRPRLPGGVKRLLRRRRGLDERVCASDFEGLDLLPADFSHRNLDLRLGEAKRPRRRLARLLEPLADEYDWVVLDCAPSLSLAAESVFRAADAVLVPVIPTPLALRTHRQLAEHLEERRRAPRLLPFFSMVDRRKGLHRRICDAAPEEWPEVLKSWIPFSSAVERMSVERAPLPAAAPRSPAALAYAALWSEVAGGLGAAP